MTMQEKVETLAAEFESEIIGIRRHLHRNPELSAQEVSTRRFIEAKLEEWGIAYRSGYSGNGVVGIVEGRKPESRCIALRAEMDALPIEEETGLDFASENKGVMHACGHDVHMACLLGAAKILQSLKDEFEGTVKLIFQPSEEDYKGGAPVMMAQGVLQNPVPQAIYALHILPELECGRIGYRSGKYMASTDEVYLKVKGKAGHGAAPERNIDPVVASAYIITALQQIVSRQASPFTPTVLSFGRIIGEGQTNVIPAEVNIDGTFRTFDEAWREKAHQAITRCAEETAKACGAECEVHIAQGYPSVCNDPKITQKLRATAERFVGAARVEELPLRMTADDFAFYTQQVPGCMFRLGVKPEDVDEPANLHTGRLVVDEACMKTGAGLLALLAMA